VVKEIGDTFDTVAAKHKRDAGPTNVFGSRYVSLFRSTLTREVDGVCAANGAIERDWGYSEKGAENIIATSRVFDRMGKNLTKEESSMIQLTVYGLGLFTKNPSERFHYQGPPGSEISGSDNFSMISNTFARQTLRTACQAVSDSLEFDDAIDAAVADMESGFDYSVQHKLCLDLDYCKVKNRKSGRSAPVQRIEQDDGTVAYETEATEADEDLGDQGVRIDPEELAKRGAAVGEEKTEL
jgi:hypothetical protein